MLKVAMSYCRSNAYLVIGVCLGLSLSLMFAPTSFDDCEDSSSAVRAGGGADAAAASWYGGSSTARSVVVSGSSTDDDYEPQINLAGKPRRAQKTPKTFVRPRYYSTELGIRDKLFVAVITSGEYLHSRGVALNKTLAHLVDRVRYFISVPEGAKPNVSLPGIVGFTDTRGILKPFHVVKYISDNYLEDYDYYYIAKDAGYVNARRLRELAERISVSWDVHLGVNVGNEDYCSLDAGILLSNSLVRKLKTSLDWCVKNTFSSSDDVNFGRCVLHATALPCANRIQGVEFRSTKLGALFDFDENFAGLAKSEERLESSISIYPVFDHHAIYKINAYLAAKELRPVEREISSLRRQILESAHLGPPNQRNTTWPVGNQPGNRALGRFDLLPWIYFNETHSFMETHAENARESVGSAKLDFTRVLESARRRIESEYRGELRFERLVNGYRRFDASRSMDYILDLKFTERASGKAFVKRIEVCKPLGKVEILPVPYVTENSRINMIHVVDTRTKRESAEFLDRYAQACMEKKDKTFLMLVLLYEPDSPSKGASDVFNDLKQRALALTDRYKKDQSKVTWLSVRLPNASLTMDIDPLLRIAIADLAAKKFTPESLLLFVDARMDLKIEYLNRVRMNTISMWQVYSPIPFVEYDPDVSARKTDNSKQSPADFDVNRNAGRYDDLNYDSISFYVKDYLTMRHKISPEIPQVRTDRDIATLLVSNDHNAVESIFQLFVTFSDLHAFRAVEPALKIRSGEIRCEGTRNAIARDLCERRRNRRLGHRGQLAKLILDYQNQS